MTGPPAIVASDPSWTVAQTIHQLLQHLDDGAFEAAAGLFAPDGVWVRQGQDLVGPPGVLAALAARPKTLSTRHLATNMVVKPAGDQMTARYYVTVFDHEGEPSEPAPLTVPHAIFVCEDRLVETADGWRFARRSPRPVFKRP